MHITITASVRVIEPPLLVAAGSVGNGKAKAKAKNSLRGARAVIQFEIRL
jgi:hypothetical protein